MEYLIDISEGDLRRCINLLQSISQLGSSSLNIDTINDICGTIPIKEIEKLFNTARFQDTEVILKEANDFLSSGYDLRQFLIQLNDLIIQSKELNDMEKGQVCNIIMESEIGLLENSSPNLKLYNLLCEIRKIFSMN